MSSDSDEVPRKAAKTSKNEPIEVEDEDKPVLSRKAQRQNKRKGQEAALDESLAPASKATKTHNVSTQKPSGQQYGIWIGNLNFATDQDHLRDWLATGLLSEQGEISRIHMPAGTTHRNKNKGFAYVDFSTEEMQKSAIALSEGHLDGRKLLIKSSSDYSGRPTNQGQPSVATDIAAILHETPKDDTAATQESRTTISKKMKRIANAQKNPPGPTLFIGNLGFETKEQDIRTLFDAHHRAKLRWQRNGGRAAERSGSESEDDSDVEADRPDAGIRQVRLGTFEDTGKCKGWAFVDFFDIKRATTSLLNPHNHYLNGRSLKVEYASAEAVRRGGNKQQKMLKPGTFKKGKRNFEETKSAEPPKPLEEIKLLSKEELEAPEAKKQHKPTKEERQAAREQRKKEQKSNSSHTRRPHQQSSAAVGSKGSKVVFDE